MTSDFESFSLGAVQPAQFNKATGGTNPVPGAYDDMTVVQDGSHGKVLRTKLDRGTIHSIPSGANNGANLFIPIAGDLDRACISYDIRFSEGFDWSLGGKLPGLLGVAPGERPALPTGGNYLGDKGWSGRLMWLGPEAYRWAGPDNMAVSYMYHPGQSSQYGDNVQWNQAFAAGQWHTVQQCFSMNTVGKADGVLQAWMDGVPVVDNRSYVYRTRGDVHINYVVWSVFRGGNTINWAGDTTNTIDFDNLAVTAG